MKSIIIDKKRVKKSEIDLIVDFLKKGKIIAYPTDTIYGLGCLATNKKAINRIYKIKKRTKNKPLLVLISDFQMLKNFFIVDKKQMTYLKKIWPAKISVILNKKTLLPNVLTSGLPGLAARLPKSRFLTKMIKKAGVPLVSTSLNLSGKEPLKNISDLLNYFKDDKPDLIINAGIKNGKPSKLIDLRDMNNLIILRK
jgi:L-threonylcarbamoyladenylate synthase